MLHFEMYLQATGFNRAIIFSNIKDWNYQSRLRKDRTIKRPNPFYDIQWSIWAFFDNVEIFYIENEHFCEFRSDRTAEYDLQFIKKTYLFYNI